MFEHLKKLEVEASKTIPYVIEDIPGEPVLHMLPATSVNKPYFNELLRAAKIASKTKRANKGKKRDINANTVAEARDDDRRGYPLKVITGWENVIDAQGDIVPFSEDACRDFLFAIPDWMMDDIRNTASNPANFSEGFETNKEGEAVLSKNL